MLKRLVIAAALVWGQGSWADAPTVSLRPEARAVVAQVTQPATTRPGELPPSRVDLAGLVAAANLGEGVAIGAVDLATRARIIDLGPDQAFPPASVTKVFTALYALENLPTGFQFETVIAATGPVQNGVIQGDLALIGGGDPTLDSDALDAMARELAAQGVTGITGRFLVWGGALPYHAEVAAEQMDHLSYNPAISGLNLNFNRVHMQWRRSGGAYRFTFEARGEDVGPQVTLPQARAADRNLPIFGSDGPDQWSIAASALGQSGARWMPVRQPAFYAGETLRVLAAGQGVSLPAPQDAATRPVGTVLASHKSAPVTEIVRGMLEYSTNLTAEILGLQATKARLGRAIPVGQSAEQMVAWLAERYGIDVKLLDHSGLEDDNRVSVDALLTLLSDPKAQALLRPVLKHIAITDAPDFVGQALAKTGTLNFVSTLAGYADGFDGRQIAFAILTADLDRRAAAIAAGQEVPEGAIAWNDRSKRLQEQALIRWRIGSADR